MKLQIEKNNGGDLMADNIQAEIDRRGITHCTVIRRSAPVKMSKEDKIGAYADFVKRNFRFLLPGKWTEVDTEDTVYKPSKQYRKAIDEMVMYSPEGKNANDDAADSITQLAMMFEKPRKTRAAVIMPSPI